MCCRTRTYHPRRAVSHGRIAGAAPARKSAGQGFGIESSSGASFAGGPNGVRDGSSRFTEKRDVHDPRFGDDEASASIPGIAAGLAAVPFARPARAAGKLRSVTMRLDWLFRGARRSLILRSMRRHGPASELPGFRIAFLRLRGRPDATRACARTRPRPAASTVRSSRRTGSGRSMSWSNGIAAAGPAGRSCRRRPVHRSDQR